MITPIYFLKKSKESKKVYFLLDFCFVFLYCLLWAT